MILDLLFPRKCVLCRRILEHNQMDLCKKCRLDAPQCSTSGRKLPYIDSWVAVWYYEDTVRESLLRYKFRDARSYARSYGRLLAMRLQQAHPEGVDLLTWIPISRRRKLQRGFDQVQLLAKYVGQELGIRPVRLLRKIRHNKPQSGIVGDAQRQANVLGAYQIADPQLVSGKRVVLLDDILTTGATASEAARVLLTAGAQEVHFGAVATARRKAK